MKIRPQVEVAVLEFYCPSPVRSVAVIKSPPKESFPLPPPTVPHLRFLVAFSATQLVSVSFPQRTSAVQLALPTLQVSKSVPQFNNLLSFSSLPNSSAFYGAHSDLAVAGNSFKHMGSPEEGVADLRELILIFQEQQKAVNRLAVLRLRAAKSENARNDLLQSNSQVVRQDSSILRLSEAISFLHDKNLWLQDLGGTN